MKKYFFVAFIGFVLLYGCNKDKFELPDSTPSYSSATVSGIVTDENGLPVPGVTVIAHGNTYTTNANGAYIFQNINVPSNRIIVSFQAETYFEVVRSEETKRGQENYIEVTMISKYSTYADQTAFLAGQEDSLVLSSGCKLIFPDDIDYITQDGEVYDGNVNIEAAYLDPSNPLYSKIASGGDLAAEDEDGSEFITEALAGLTVEVTDDAGEPLQLTSGAQKATGGEIIVEFAIPAAYQSSAPSTTTLCSYSNSSSNTSGLNKVEGTATKTGNKYVAQLRHFSYWTCNIEHDEKAVIEGTVVDDNGSPVPGVYVRIGQTYALTNNSGKYRREVPDNIDIEVGINTNDMYFGNFITPQTANAMTGGSSTTIDFTVPAMTRITGTLVDCNGLPVEGKVMITWGANQYTQTYTKSGIFELQIESSALSATVYAYGNSNNTSITVMPAGDPYNVGNIELCPPPTQMKIENVIYNQFSTTDSGGWVVMNHHGDISKYFSATITGSDGEIYMTTPEKQLYTKYAITQSKSSCNSAYFSFYDYTDSYYMTSGWIMFTRFDAPGGKIEGLFQGVLDDGRSVTSGKFTIYRKQDEEIIINKK